MSALVLLSLPLSLLLVASVAGLAVLDAAMRDASFAGKAGARTLPGAGLPAIEMLQSTACLAGENPVGEARLTCSDARFVPQVTEIEARLMASEISRQGADEVHRILLQSRNHEGFCPMRLADGLCACTLVRPLDCVGRCVAGADSPEWADGLGHSVSTAFRQHLKLHHANDTTQRLDAALLELLDKTPCINSTTA